MLKTMTKKGNFDIFLKADIITKSTEKGKSYFVQGVGSTIEVDRQGERLSEKALARLEEISTTKRIPVFSQHEHSWENTMGYIDESIVKDGQWKVSIALEDPSYNEKTKLLVNKKEHGTPIGLSIGGRVLKAYDEKSDDSLTRVIDDLELLELSIVGIPANQSGSVISYIAKSLEKGDNNMTKEIKKEDEVIQEEEAKPEVQEEVKEEPKQEEVKEEVKEEEKEVKEEAPAEESAESKEASLSVKVNQIEKDVKEIAKNIAGLKASQKNVIVNTEKEQFEVDEEKSMEKMLEERLK